ncbi:MAG: hypothetical protein ACLFO1_10310 [Spirochaetaceae bacterium]
MALFATLAIIAVVAPLAAQDGAPEPNIRQFDQALGGFAGYVGGVGISYQKWLGSFGWQVAGGGYYLPSEEGQYAIGVEGMYQIHEAALHDRVDSMLYAVAGVGHYADITPDAFDARIHGGIGLGVETVLFEHFSFPLELLYTGSFVVTDLTAGDFGLQPAGGVRFRY